MKKIILIGTLLVSLNTLQAESIQGAVAEVAKEKIKADRDVAIAAINKGTEVSVSNSEINIRTKLKNGAIVGNTGLIAVGTKVTIDNTKIDIETDVENGILVGNSGIILGGH